MRGYRRYVIIFTGIMVLLLVGMNLVFRNIENSSRGNHYYKVEIHRALQDEALQNEIVQADEQKQIICIDLTSRDIKTADSNAAYETLESLEVLPKNASELQIHDFYQIDNRPYTIIEDQGHILRFTYREVSTDSWTLYFLNITLLITAAVGYLVLFTMYMAVVRPFERIEAFPDELARGQLAGELPQTKNHLFCRFIWGLNMLRDKLEERKQK